MIEIALILAAILLAATTYAAIEYYRQLRRAQKEYEKARDSVEDVVMSFNRELKRETERIESIAYKLDATTSQAGTALKKAEAIETRMTPMESQLTAQATTFASASESNAQTLNRVASVDAKLQEMETLGEALKNRIAGLEEQVQRLTALPEARPELAVPVIPIRRDKALAALTDTEVAVLEYLSSEGPKTAPEIKQKVQLSREHTARLMKKLYEEGYLERETGKLPFKYSVKKEMEKLLRRPETSAT
ncbi:MAG: helix-turn-helix domain-containing protein [Candidatus Bathyarchaeia archaeon]